MEMYQEHHRMFRSLSTTRLFFRCAVPSMISMAFSSLYMIADGIFVGRFLGSQALAAVNLVMPIIIMSFAISDMVAVGSAVQISIALGRKDTQKANQLFSFACSIIFVISCIVCLLGLCLAPALVSLLGSTGMVANLATQYLRVYAGFSPVIMCFFAVDNYLRICGKVKYSMAMNVFISISNILLDALFLGFFHFGIASAAVASCICLTSGSIICFYPFLRKKLILRFVRFKISPKIIRNIFANGSSEFFSNISSSVCMVLFNSVLLHLSGYLAVAAFSIVMYVDSVMKSALFGMADALQPAISYNYGAADKKRVFALEHRVWVAAGLISFGVMCWMLTAGDSLVSLFIGQNEEELFRMSIRAMKLFALSYLFGWCGIVFSSFFTSLNRPVFSFLVSFSQTLLFPSAGLFFLSTVWGLDGVWLSAFFSSILSLVLSGFLLVLVIRKQTGWEKIEISAE